MKCKTCGKENHYCSSCDWDSYLSVGYCDRECFVNSEFYKKEKFQFLNFLDRLDKDALRGLKLFLDFQSHLFGDDYPVWIDQVLEERK